MKMKYIVKMNNNSTNEIIHISEIIDNSYKLL